MSEKDSQTIKVKMLSADAGYYASVFKKTEKIISVIFYVLSHTSKRQIDEAHVARIRELTFSTHDELLKTLTLPRQSAADGLLELQYELAGLESALRIGEAAGVIGSEVLAVLLEQFDLVQRFINNHYTKDTSYSLELSQLSTQLGGGEDEDGGKGREGMSDRKPKSSPKAPRKQRVQIPAGDISTDAYLVYSQMTDRAERIKTVLDAKPQATVKDIAEVITDVSEKTIQRELNSLIEKGEVVREGERRWSRYSTVKK
jgi:hypothetical protein